MKPLCAFVSFVVEGFVSGDRHNPTAAVYNLKFVIT